MEGLWAPWAHSTVAPPQPSAEAKAKAAAVALDGAGAGEFECRTCSRRFPSFQALGGHRTGHARLEARRRRQQHHHGRPEHAAATGGRHECAVCGLEFPMGQALGGHMRRHRGAAARVGDEAERPEVLDLNHPPVEDRGGDQQAQCFEPEPRLLNLLV